MTQSQRIVQSTDGPRVQPGPPLAAARRSAPRACGPEPAATLVVEVEGLDAFAGTREDGLLDAPLAGGVFLVTARSMRPVPGPRLRATLTRPGLNDIQPCRALMAALLTLPTGIVTLDARTQAPGPHVRGPVQSVRRGTSIEGRAMRCERRVEPRSRPTVEPGGAP
jgi:hypothetical protein